MKLPLTISGCLFYNCPCHQSAAAPPRRIFTRVEQLNTNSFVPILSRKAPGFGEQPMLNTCFLTLFHYAWLKAESRSFRQPLATLDRFALRIQRQQPGTAPEGELDEE